MQRQWAQELMGCSNVPMLCSADGKQVIAYAEPATGAKDWRRAPLLPLPAATGLPARDR